MQTSTKSQVYNFNVKKYIKIARICEIYTSDSDLGRWIRYLLIKG